MAATFSGSGKVFMAAKSMKEKITHSGTLAV